MPPFSPLSPADQPGYLLVRAAELAAKPWLRGLNSQGINPRQFSVLALLEDDPGLSQAELARRALITPQSMAELVARLEANGLVHRVMAGVGRPARVSLSEDGRRTLTAAYPVVSRLQDDSLAALSDAERHELARLLTKVIQSHEKMADQVT